MKTEYYNYIMVVRNGIDLKSSILINNNETIRYNFLGFYI